MDEKTRNVLARIAVEWHTNTTVRAGNAGEASRRRASNGDQSAMSPIALRHRRYQQLIRLRKAS
jgi:hypothetical protein